MFRGADNAPVASDDDLDDVEAGGVSTRTVDNAPVAAVAAVADASADDVKAGGVSTRGTFRGCMLKNHDEIYVQNWRDFLPLETRT
jgi:hypothetical protein